MSDEAEWQVPRPGSRAAEEHASLLHGVRKTRSDDDRAVPGYLQAVHEEDDMLKLIRIDNAKTPEATRILDLFGTTVLPLPLTNAVSQKDALAFARQTEAGREYGVSL